MAAKSDKTDKTETDVGRLVVDALIQFARLGRVTDETYDALKGVLADYDADETDDQGDDDADDGDDDAKTDKATGASKASASRKATAR